jgi:hypothetical protein
MMSSKLKKDTDMIIAKILKMRAGYDLEVEGKEDLG